MVYCVLFYPNAMYAGDQLRHLTAVAKHHLLEAVNILITGTEHSVLVNGRLRSVG